MKALEDAEKKKKEGPKSTTPSEGTSEPTESEDKKDEIKKAIEDHQKKGGKI